MVISSRLGRFVLIGTVDDVSKIPYFYEIGTAITTVNPHQQSGITFTLMASIVSNQYASRRAFPKARDRGVVF